MRPATRPNARNTAITAAASVSGRPSAATTAAKSTAPAATVERGAEQVGQPSARIGAAAPHHVQRRPHQRNRRDGNAEHPGAGAASAPRAPGEHQQRERRSPVPRTRVRRRRWPRSSPAWPAPHPARRSTMASATNATIPGTMLHAITRRTSAPRRSRYQAASEPSDRAEVIGARWKPNARPRTSGGVTSAISASRGGVRSPLPHPVDHPEPHHLPRRRRRTRSAAAPAPPSRSPRE